MDNSEPGLPDAYKDKRRWYGYSTFGYFGLVLFLLVFCICDWAVISVSTVQELDAPHLYQSVLYELMDVGMGRFH